MTRLITIASIAVMSLSSAALAGDEKKKRQLDAHEHGHSTLNVGIEGKTVNLELEAPGADIVGFEYVAETAADKAKVATAKKALADPLNLFRPTAAAGCTLTNTDIDLVVEGNEKHEEHAHDDHDDDDHKKKAKHDDHDHDDHDDEAKHDEAEKGGHNEFHAKYTLTCSNPGALKDFSFTFFEAFKGAEELEVNVVSEKGQRRFEVERDEPKINLDSLT